MAAFWDRMETTSQDTPFVLLAPKFGESKKNNLQSAYYLAQNGLNVFRFDHTDHPGDSAGEIADYTFRGATEDLLDTLDYLERSFRAREVVLMANSMSVRPAIRAAARDSRVARLISLVGMINFQATARAVYLEDMVQLHLEGNYIGITDILGHQVNVRRFLQGAIEENMHDLEGTLIDMRESTADFFFICGEKDTWVDPADLSRLRISLDSLKIRWVPGAMHELRENPKSADLAFREAVFACNHGRFSHFPSELNQVALPSQKEILEQNRRERERLRKANPIITPERSFWGHYLGKYGILEQIPDFQEYTQLLLDCLGEVEDDDCILDAGCGNGLVGSFFLRHLDNRTRGDEPVRPVYFGLDLTKEGLAEAIHRHARPPAPASVDFQYLRYDLEVVGRTGKQHAIELPFDSNTFDKICCSLLVSYLNRPEAFLRECYRVLKSGGRIVVSSMKPHCDLSHLYTRLLEDSGSPEVVEQARDLLSAAGAIRLKEEQGHYTFFSSAELQKMARTAGFAESELYRSFGNQANLIVAVK